MIVSPSRTVEEVVLHLEGDRGQIVLPVAVVAEHDQDRLLELRVYFSTLNRTGRRTIRPPLLQPDMDVEVVDVFGEYQRALAAGDAQDAVAAFERHGYLGEPGGISYDQLQDGFELFFSNGGGILLEHCTGTDDGQRFALEYNILQWGVTDLPPQAGLAVFVQADSSRLTAARI